MANAARWIHAVRVNPDNGKVEVTVGPTRHTQSGTEYLEALPRHEIRRVCAHLGLSGAATRSKEDMLEEIRGHCSNLENVGDNGRVSSRRYGSSTPTVDTPSTSRSSVPSSGGGVLGAVLEQAVDARVDARLDSALEVVLERLGNTVGNVSVDRLEVESIVESILERDRVNGSRVVSIDGVKFGHVEGRVHRDFDRLLVKIASARNVFMTGEAGIGKTFVVDQIAAALEVESVIVSADPLPQRSEILGYVSPTTGQAIHGAVRHVYEYGGVFCLDEIDTGHTSLGTSLNRLLSSSSFDFPKDGGGLERVRRHDKFVVVATGNTFGNGPSIRYVGTNKMNGASLDRFTMFHMATDENLTRLIAEDLSSEHGPRAFAAWERLRRNVERYSLDVLVSPRACLDAVRGLAYGESLDEAFNGRAHGRGLPTDIERKLVEGVFS